MADFDAGFALRHAAALADIDARIGLDYFGIDCAETPDGRLLVFEVDIAMIVHAMDDRRSTPTSGRPWARCSRPSRPCCMRRRNRAF